MSDFIMHMIFSTIWGWIGTAGLVVIGCAVLGYIFPTLRFHLLAIVAVVVSAAYIYAKAVRDERANHNAKVDKARGKLHEKYEEIDNRKSNDPLRDMVDGMRDGRY